MTMSPVGPFRRIGRSPVWSLLGHSCRALSLVRRRVRREVADIEYRPQQLGDGLHLGSYAVAMSRMLVLACEILA